jgi:hypothetical protein
MHIGFSMINQRSTGIIAYVIEVSGYYTVETSWQDCIDRGEDLQVISSANLGPLCMTATVRPIEKAMILEKL